MAPTSSSKLSPNDQTIAARRDEVCRQLVALGPPLDMKQSIPSLRIASNSIQTQKDLAQDAVYRAALMAVSIAEEKQQNDAKLQNGDGHGQGAK